MGCAFLPKGEIDHPRLCDTLAQVYLVQHDGQFVAHQLSKYFVSSGRHEDVSVPLHTVEDAPGAFQWHGRPQTSGTSRLRTSSRPRPASQRRRGSPEGVLRPCPPVEARIERVNCPGHSSVMSRASEMWLSLFTTKRPRNYPHRVGPVLAPWMGGGGPLQEAGFQGIYHSSASFFFLFSCLHATS